MESLLLDILARLRERPDADALAPVEVERLVRAHNRGIKDNARHLAKKRILPFYLHIRETQPERWASWQVDDALERRLFATLRMKPRRTASGVATITVITRPHPCSSNCVFCPCDIRMPKSYLANEPACQRAERAFFDPYLQVTCRLRALDQMGHATDKVELIVLGGTWSDYDEPYQLWFVRELFRALNDWGDTREGERERRAHYRRCGLSADPDELAFRCREEQRLVSSGAMSYNDAVRRIYGATDADAPWARAASIMHATRDELEAEHRRNETAAHRVVGLVIETRPDRITPESLTLLRRLGCTKVQMGVQSTRQEVLDACGRRTDVGQVVRALALTRLFGFKIHAHLMANLPTSTPEADKEDFRTFVEDPRFSADEIKLYPCSLVWGTRLVALHEQGAWHPYTQEELLDVLVSDTMATPPHTRISRMVRDISAGDILVGNKQANLRQLVEARIEESGLAPQVRDIRFREINQGAVDLATLTLDEVAFDTTVTRERFLQWVTPEGQIVAFLRLSLPRWDVIASDACAIDAAALPTRPGDAMIREVHVYGLAAHLGRSDSAAQHQGLGRRLVERARQIATDAGYERLHVISSVGTRAYYRRLGFSDTGLYQTAVLADDAS